MRSSIFFIASIFILLSCGNETESNNATAQDTATADITNTVATAAKTECYAKADKDTVLLRTSSINGSVNGTLYIHYDGKDVNQGNIAGDMMGDTLIADYTFYSEGVQSVRQVAFLKTENGIIEGFGEIEERDNKMVFKNITALKFEDKMKLSKVSCTF